MNYDNLTNFDKHVLAQGDSRFFADSAFSAPEKTPADPFGAYRAPVQEKTDEELYEEYLIKELRRTAPGVRPLMREEEFLAELHGKQYVADADTASYSAPAFLSGVASMTAEEVENAFVPEKTEKKHTRKRLFSNVRAPRLTKTGKIILIVYIILCLAIASILIVSNTNVAPTDFYQSANASYAVESEENPTVIKAMTVEDEEETHANWFDKLCDSLNK